jgi:hypothetical protein
LAVVVAGTDPVRLCGAGVGKGTDCAAAAALDAIIAASKVPISAVWLVPAMCFSARAPRLIS